jgi:hypothetical protein
MAGSTVVTASCRAGESAGAPPAAGCKAAMGGAGAPLLSAGAAGFATITAVSVGAMVPSTTRHAGGPSRGIGGRRRRQCQRRMRSRSVPDEMP